jgi:pre-mRNA-processing factor 40
LASIKPQKLLDTTNEEFVKGFPFKVIIMFSALPPAKETPSKQSKAAPRTQVVFKDKREAMEAFKDLLREKNVPSSATWLTL